MVITNHHNISANFSCKGRVTHCLALPAGTIGILLVCLWRHSCHVGGQEQKHFSPLGTKLYFHVNSLRKNSIVLTPNMAAMSRGCKPRIKILRRHLYQIQGNWAGRNFVIESRANSRLITHARSEIYNRKQTQLSNNKFINGILGGTLDLSWL